MQTLYLASLDERVKAAVISGYFYGFKDSFVRLNTNCSCNFVPSLFLHFDVADIAGLVAPRPLVIQSAREDHLAGERGLENVLEPMNELKKVYSLLGAENRICHHIVGGPHHFEKEGIMEAIDSVCLH